uniref:Uncharacterized protein n=1 Tax=Heliothis virescens TaxID=7102 RepID=A0A2A4JVF4_HELVI
MDLALFVLILQIGFNAALNYRHNNQIAIIRSQLLNHEPSRRSSSYNRYLQPTTRTFLDSDSQESDFDYTSDEENSGYRSSSSYERKKNPTQYDNKADNVASPEPTPGRLDSDKHVEPLDTVKDKDLRRLYLGRRTLNRRHAVTPTDDIKNLEDAVHRRAANYLKLLLTIVEEKNNRRNLNDEHKDSINNLATSRENFLDSHLIEPANSKKLNHEDRNSHESDSKYYLPQSQRRTGNIDAALFMPVLRSQIRLPEPLKPSKSKVSNRNVDDDDVDENDEDDYDYDYEYKDSIELPSVDQERSVDDLKDSYVQSFIEIKPIIESLLATYDDANNKNNTVAIEALLDKLRSFTNLTAEDEEDTDEAVSLRLSDLEDFKTPRAKNHDGKINGQKDNKNTVRLLISPIEKVMIDENGSSNFSAKLADLEIIPVKLRVGIPSDKQNRKEQHESHKKRLRSQVMRFRNSDNLNAEIQMLRNLKQNLLKNLDIREDHKNLKSEKCHKHLRNKNNHKHDDDESIASNNDSEDDYDSDFDDNFADDESGDRSKSLNKTHSSQENTIKISEKENDNKTNVTHEPLTSAGEEDDGSEANTTLHLEFPWNDQPSPSDNNNTSSEGDIEEFLRNYTKHKAEDYAVDLQNPFVSLGNTSEIANSDDKSTNETALHKDEGEDQPLDFEYLWKSVIGSESNKSHVEIADSKNDTVDNELRSHEKDKDDNSTPENPVRSKDKSDEGTSTEKIQTRSSDPLYEHPLLRQNAQENDKGPWDDSMDNFLRQIDSKLNPSRSGNKNEYILAEKYLRDAGEVPDISEEGQAFIMVPLDRRPHHRLRSNKDLPFILSQLSPQIRSKTYNDTIIFRDTDD